MPETRSKKSVPFQFVLDELTPLRPVVKQMFGFTYLYLDETLLFGIREQIDRPNTNGIWIFTDADHLESLRREFPLLSRRNFWKSGNKGWVVLSSKNENFEEYAYRACELALRGDRRLGRVTRAGRSAGKQVIPLLRVNSWIGLGGAANKIHESTRKRGPRIDTKKP